MRPATVLEQTARHQKWAWRRFKIWQAMERGIGTCERRDRFATCGSRLTLNVRGDDLVLTCFCCGDRWCEACQDQKRRRLREQIQIIVAERQADVRFFTFTLRHSNTPLPDQIKRLRHSLRLLHRRQWWQQHCRGGIDCIEVKLDKARNLWHVHAHCLVEGTWCDQAELARTWYAITGDSSVVDVRRTTTAEEAARYATKYATKPVHEEVYAVPAKLDEALAALKGARLTQCWGAWHGLDKPDEDAAPELREIGTIARLIDASLDGDAGARLYLQLACCKWPELEHQVPTAAIAALPPPPPEAQPPPDSPPIWQLEQAEQLPF